jgi:hypothetical protein
MQLGIFNSTVNEYPYNVSVYEPRDEGKEQSMPQASHILKIVVRSAIVGALVVLIGMYFRAPLWAIVFVIAGLLWLDSVVSGYGRLRKEVSMLLCELRGHSGDPDYLIGKPREVAPCLRCGQPYLMKSLGSDQLFINSEYADTIVSRLEDIEQALAIEPRAGLKYLGNTGPEKDAAP